MTQWTKPEPPESDLQSKIIQLAQVRGYVSFKVTSPSRRGVKDVYALRAGRHVWMEVKRPGEEPTRQQARFAQEMRDHGGEIYAVDSLEQAREILR